MPDALGFCHPKDKRCLAPAVGDIALKIIDSSVNGYLEPGGGFIRSQGIHRSFEAGDDKVSVVDGLKVAFRPTCFMETEELAEAAG